VNIIERIKSRRFLVNLGLFFLSIFILIFLLSFFLRIYTHHGESLTVPDFRNRTIEEVKKMCDDKGLRYEIKDSVFDPGKPRLTVIDQNPKPNSKVKLNRRIYLILNAGRAPKVALPNLKNEQRRQADRILQSIGLIPGTHPEYIHDIALNTVQDIKYNGKIISPGTLIDKGSVIEYVLADGGQAGASVVPNLTDNSIVNATFMLSEAHLILGQVDSTGVKNTRTAIIYKQNPLPGKKISYGDIVNVWLKDK
jgi:eukaryotic-like serine/threonine-protein kinase